MLLQIDKLKTSTFKYIESEVYSFHDTLKQIKLLEYEIMNSSTNNDDENNNVGRNSTFNTSSPTEKKATELLTHKQLARMKRITEAIQKIYDNLDEDRKKLMRIYYWERPGELTWEGIAKEVHVARRTALRWREQIIYAIAHELGER